METKTIRTNRIEMFYTDFNKMVKKAKKLGYSEPSIDSIVELLFGSPLTKITNDSIRSVLIGITTLSLIPSPT